MTWRRICTECGETTEEDLPLGLGARCLMCTAMAGEEEEGFKVWASRPRADAESTSVPPPRPDGPGLASTDVADPNETEDLDQAESAFPVPRDGGEELRFGNYVLIKRLGHG